MAMLKTRLSYQLPVHISLDSKDKIFPGHTIYGEVFRKQISLPRMKGSQKDMLTKSSQQPKGYLKWQVWAGLPWLTELHQGSSLPGKGCN